MHGRGIVWHLQKHVAWMPMLSLPSSWSPAVVAAAVIGWEHCGKPAVHLLATIPRSDCSLYWTLNFAIIVVVRGHGHTTQQPTSSSPAATPAKTHLKDFSHPPPLLSPCSQHAPPHHDLSSHTPQGGRWHHLLLQILNNQCDALRR